MIFRGNLYNRRQPQAGFPSDSSGIWPNQTPTLAVPSMQDFRGLPAQASAPASTQHSPGVVENNRPNFSALHNLWAIGGGIPLFSMLPAMRNPLTAPPQEALMPSGGFMGPLFPNLPYINFNSVPFLLHQIMSRGYGMPMMQRRYPIKDVFID